MNLLRATVVLLVHFVSLTVPASGFYIKNAGNAKSNKIAARNNNAHTRTSDEWNVFKQKLGLSNEKIELLKSQKDQQGTLELLHRFVEENPNYIVDKEPAVDDTEEPKTSYNFMKVYHHLLKQLKFSGRRLKTSLNFELADKPQKSLKRSRRKIAVKMVSDMPSEKIDELLKVFNEKHGLSDSALDKEDDKTGDDNSDIDADTDTDTDYAKLPSSSDPDYIYENLYEDEGDLTRPAKSNKNSQYGSFQDLILQATRNQWQKEVEEMKLRSRDNEHFI